MANIAKFKQIAADVVKMGKEAAIEKYGEKEIKAAQDSLRRNAEKIRKRKQFSRLLVISGIYILQHV